MHVLSCWELGTGLGHLDRMLGFAVPLMARGHRVDWVVRDLSRVGARSLPEGLAVGQAPVWLPQAKQPPPMATYGSVLFAAGWMDPVGLAGLVRGWWRWFDLIQPDLVTLDHAPTALLAAKLAGLPVRAVGNSFELPPLQAHFPLSMWWANLPPEHPRQVDGVLLKPLNEALARLGAAPWQRLTQLFDGVPRAIVQPRALAHYEGYDDAAVFLGGSYEGQQGALPNWPDGVGPRVFAYLSANHAGFDALMSLLIQRRCRTLVFAKNLSAEQHRSLASPHLHLSSQPLQVDATLAESDFVVTHASIGTVTAAALAGKPQLGLPQHTEQWMVGQRLARLGIGLSGSVPAPRDEAARLMQRLLDDPTQAVAAQRFAAELHDQRPAETSRRVADWLTQGSADLA